MVIRLQDVAAKAESTAAEYLLAAAAAVLFDFGQARRACRVIAILDALAVVLKASRRAQASPVAVHSRVPRDFRGQNIQSLLYHTPPPPIVLSRDS